MQATSMAAGSSLATKGLLSQGLTLPPRQPFTARGIPLHRSCIRSQQLPPLETSVEQGTGQKSKTVSREVGTMKGVAGSLKEAVEDAPVRSFGKAAAYAGAATLALVLSQGLLASIEALPLIPAALQFVGVTYSGWLASRLIKVPGGSKEEPRKMEPVSHLVDKEALLQDGVDEATIDVIWKVAQQRDQAIAQVEEMRDVTKKMTRVCAEKKALEAVAVQLAEERDQAQLQVSALKSAVDGMTERMRNIEAMLEAEVGELKLQNQALETVALQLASERDRALTQVSSTKEKNVALQEENEQLQRVLARLQEERDGALHESAELRKVLATLKSESSALVVSPEAEVLLKTKLRNVRSEYIDIEKTYDEQADAVERLVAHLTEEYGAPKEWTMEYMKQFLDSPSAQQPSLGIVNVSSLAKSPQNVSSLAKKKKRATASS